MQKFFKKIAHIFLIFFLFFSTLSVEVFALEREILGAKITTNGTPTIDERRVNILEKIFHSVYFPFSYRGLSVFIDVNQTEPRGQIRGGDMKLSANIARDAEFIQLFTHELGHFVDIMLLRGSQFSEDPSKVFYRISWQDVKVKHPSSKMSDFISGYSATNQYEDFAEAFVWYVFHNEDFRTRAMKNEILRQKYLFFADYVFTDGQFQGTDFSL